MSTREQGSILMGKKRSLQVLRGMPQNGHPHSHLERQKPRPGEPEGGPDPALLAQESAVHRVRLWSEGPSGGLYLDSVCSAPGAVPGRAPAARGQSGPGQVPHCGCGAGRTRGFLSTTQQPGYSALWLQYPPLPVILSLGLVPSIPDSAYYCLCCHSPPSVSLYITLLLGLSCHHSLSSAAAISLWSALVWPLVRSFHVALPEACHAKDVLTPLCISHQPLSISFMALPHEQSYLLLSPAVSISLPLPTSMALHCLPSS